MQYKDKDLQREKAREKYYKNREKRIEYQREYDKNNKDKKSIQDKKRYKTKAYNLKQKIRHYSQKYHFPILLKKYKGCQFCGSKIKLEIHHTKYTKLIKNCLLLCSKCHKKIHRKIL